MEDERQYLDRVVAGMKPDRDGFDPHWRELSSFMSPRSTRFFTSDRSNAGGKMNAKILDNTAVMAARTFASGFQSGVTSASRPWFQMRTADPDLNKYKPVKEYMETVRRIISETFLKSNIYTTLPQAYRDLGVFGTTAFTIMKDEEDIIRCYRFPLGSYWLGTNDRGVVDAIAREYEMTVSQMVRSFGLTNCSSSVRDHYTRGNYNTWIKISHLIMPNRDFAPARVLSLGQNKPYISVFWETGNPERPFLRRSGFRGFPAMCPRWETNGEDVYGHSCGMEALGDTKQLQTEQSKKARMIEKGNVPPMGAPSSLRNNRVSMLSGDMTIFDVNQGQQGVAPLYVPSPAWISPLIEDIRECQDRIKRAFYEDLFLMLANDGRSGTTAREISELHQEKLEGLGPALERMNDELYDPMIDRTFDLLEDSMMLPPAPPELIESGLSIEYISTMHQAQKMAQVSGIERLSRYVGEIGGAFPDAMDVFVAPAAVELMADSLGTPPELTRSSEERMKIVADRNQKAQMQEQLAAATQAAGAANQGAQAANTLSQTQVTEPSMLNDMMNLYRGGGTAL